MLFKYRTLAVALATVVAAAPAVVPSFPERPITFVVPFGAGTATDQLARALAPAITAETKQPVVVENRIGASGMIAAQQVAKAPPDGYTVLISTNTTHAANEHLYRKIGYDPVKDFTPITLLGKGVQMMLVPPNFPAKTVAEFIAMAKKEPGKLSFASGSSSSRMAGELLQQMAGIELLHVPYKSNTLAITDVIGGQVNSVIPDTATALPQVRSGKLRALATTGSKRAPQAPDVPTIAEAGVPGYEMGYWFAAYAPANTPAPVVKRLHELLIRAVSSSQAKSFYDNSGVDPATSTPEELARFQVTESQKWGRIIKAAKIEPE